MGQSELNSAKVKVGLGSAEVSVGLYQDWFKSWLVGVLIRIVWREVMIGLGERIEWVSLSYLIGIKIRLCCCKDWLKPMTKLNTIKIWVLWSKGWDLFASFGTGYYQDS